MPDIVQRISIDATRDRVHDLIATTDGVARWWTGGPLAGAERTGLDHRVQGTAMGSDTNLP